MGFPLRASRRAFGATNLRDCIPVRDPETAISAAIYKLTFWQIAGVNVTGALAWAELVIDGAGDPTLGEHAESWDADGALAPPEPIKLPIPGGYRLTYAVEYPDENGDNRVTQLRFVEPSIQSLTTLWHAQGKPSAANVIDIQVWNAAGAATNPVSESIFVPIW
jgi:hypothetical protein